jgi:hypothetical protein
MATDNNHPVWEYRVIHLNVSPPAGSSQAKSARPVSDGPPPPSVKQPPKPTPSAEPQKSGSPNPIFSQAYLEQEFPSFYSHPPSSRQGASGGGGQSSHPAHQLQSFLNTNGEHGWELVGFYPVGPLMLMIFRRQKLVEAEKVPVEPKQSVSTSSSPSPDLLSRILDRLEQLESTVGAGDAAKPVAEDSQDVSQPRILSSEELHALEKLPALTTQQAAEAIGYRSVETLQRFLRRHGSKPGLVKANISGAAVVYRGKLIDPESGREQGMWCVLPDAMS